MSNRCFLDVWGEEMLRQSILSFLMVCSCIQVSMEHCDNPHYCRTFQMELWQRWITYGMGRCFQAHNFHGLSNDIAIFRFTHLLPSCSDSLLRLSVQHRAMTLRHVKYLLRLRICPDASLKPTCTFNMLVIRTCWCQLPQVAVSAHKIH